MPAFFKGVARGARPVVPVAGFLATTFEAVAAGVTLRAVAGFLATTPGLHIMSAVKAQSGSRAES